ncbi:MAG: lysophospholipase [Rhodospirillaceae bacterium]|nr:lysophospholipase [Rhodospirillaceae bacterium]
MRALLAFTVACALWACAPITAPPGRTPTEPHLTEKAFVTHDGLALPLRRWLPEGAVKGVVVALHGFNDYAKAFDKIPAIMIGTGPYLAGQGFAVYAYDQRGFGASPNAGLWPGEKALIADFTDLAALLRRAHPGVPIYGLGESMGGAVIMAAVAGKAAGAQTPPVDGVVLAAPAVWARATMPFYYRIPLWLGARLMPGFKPSPKGLGFQASNNIDLLRDNARDPLFIKETRVDAIYGLATLMDAALASTTRIRVPTLYLYGAKDQIIPRKPTLQAMQGLGPNAKPAFYAQGWHIVLRDKEAETVLKDVAAFMANPTAPLPSGADENAVDRLRTAPPPPKRK